MPVQGSPIQPALGRSLHFTRKILKKPIDFRVEANIACYLYTKYSSSRFGFLHCSKFPHFGSKREEERNMVKEG